MFNFLKRKKKFKFISSDKKAYIVLDCSKTTAEWYKLYGRCVGGVNQYHKLSFIGIKYIGCDDELEELKSNYHISHNIDIIGNTIYGTIHNLNKFLYYCNIFRKSNFVILSLEGIISYLDPNYACDRYDIYPYCDNGIEYDITNSMIKYARIPIVTENNDDKALLLEFAEDYVRTDTGIVVSMPLIPAIELTGDLEYVEDQLYRILDKDYEDGVHNKTYESIVNEILISSMRENILDSIENAN